MTDIQTDTWTEKPGSGSLGSVVEMLQHWGAQCVYYIQLNKETVLLDTAEPDPDLASHGGSSLCRGADLKMEAWENPQWTFFAHIVNIHTWA